ncbi:MAG: phytoene/squalene synthase family protein [Gammaproteobacteria bacterium]
MDDDQFQDLMLQGVSRTFALTIPQLPVRLHRVVANAYLLCRIADTIEDDPALDPAQTSRFSEWLVDITMGEGDSAQFAQALKPLLSDSTLPMEHELIGETPRVLAITAGFSEAQRAELARCVRIMSRGMARFQAGASVHGLADLPELDAYCYFVAGVVGECLTGLFCDYSEEIAVNRDAMAPLSVSFGQGLQMTNIIKDIWDDRARGVCWLPRDVFAAHGFDLSELDPDTADPRFEAGLADLIAIAMGHLRNALRFTLYIPAHERGIRNFCLWAIGMAVLTLRRVNAQRGFRAGSEVKISRRSVRATVLGSKISAGSDGMLRLMLALMSRGLPRFEPERERRVTAVGPQPEIRA